MRNRPFPIEILLPPRRDQHNNNDVSITTLIRKAPNQYTPFFPCLRHPIHLLKNVLPVTIPFPLNRIKRMEVINAWNQPGGEVDDEGRNLMG